VDDVAAEHPGVRSDQGGQHPDQGRLPRSVGPNSPNSVPSSTSRIDPSKRRGRPKALDHTLDVDGRIRHHSLSREMTRPVAWRFEAACGPSSGAPVSWRGGTAGDFDRRSRAGTSHVWQCGVVVAVCCITTSASAWGDRTRAEGSSVRGTGCPGMLGAPFMRGVAKDEQATVPCRRRAFRPHGPIATLVGQLNALPSPPAVAAAERPAHQVPTSRGRHPRRRRRPAP
jgi:hypothetical protein